MPRCAPKQNRASGIARLRRRQCVFRNTTFGDKMKPYTKRILIPAFMVAALAAGVAYGKECKGVNFPDQAQVEGANLTLNGLGLRQATAFKVNVYVTALYVAKTSNDANALLGASTPSE